MNYSIGFGYDIHKLAKGRKLILGGVEIPYSKGLLGHSDADVALHAVCDAILGAAGLEDIGKHFPDTDKRYKDISSVVLVKKAIDKIKKKKKSINNVDVTIICQSPRLENFKKLMRENISKVLNLSSGFVNVKAKTNEGFGGIGKGNFIAAYAVALLKNR